MKGEHVRGVLARTLDMKQPKIILYSHRDCPPCHILKLLLEEKGVVYEERDLTASPDLANELMERYHSHCTPTLVIGEEVIIGFNPERLDEILGE